MRDLRLIGKAKRRTRRPTADELTRLREHFRGRDRRAQIPMEAIMDFAIASARREAQICRLEWRDNDKTIRAGTVRDATGLYTRRCLTRIAEPPDPVSTQRQVQVVQVPVAARESSDRS